MLTERIYYVIFYGNKKAAPGFELGNKGFAILCLTTWPCRRNRSLKLRIISITEKF
jgi:hypothetical protein